MAKLQINRLTNCNVYLEGQNFLGRAEEVGLPSIKRVMEEFKGLGMMAKVNLPTGVLELLEASFKWGSFYPEVMKATLDPSAIVNLQVRAAIDQYTGAGRSAQIALIVTMGCIFMEKPLGNLAKATPTTLEDKATVYYLKVNADGEDLYEVDVLNNIEKIAGEDILSRFRAIVGA